MPKMVRYFIKASFVYFLAALVMGLLLVARPVFPLPGWTSALNPVYLHLFMVGWVTQIIFGVSFWMFPSGGDQRFGNENLIWATFWLINAGLVLRALMEPLAVLQAGRAIWGYGLALSALLQWLAGMAYVYNIWNRVRGK